MRMIVSCNGWKACRCRDQIYPKKSNLPFNNMQLFLMVSMRYVENS
jgi:hypothetical protein